MSRSALFVACLLGALVIALCQGYGDQEAVTPTAQTNVAVKSETASSVPSLMAYPQNLDARAVALSVPRAISSVDVITEDHGGYKPPESYKKFVLRRLEIVGTFWREMNDPRVKQGLEPLLGPKVDLTPEERVIMISEFQVGIREINEVTTKQGYPSQDIVSLLEDLHDAGITPSELDSKSHEAIVRLGQAQADYQAKYVEQLLERGCPGTASYIMDMYVNRLAKALDDPASMGYTHLNERIATLHAMERSYARASTEEATSAVVVNLARQRAKSLPGCGFG